MITACIDAVAGAVDLLQKTSEIPEYKKSDDKGTMNAKRKGSKNEHKAIRILEDAGYSCTRAAGSLGMFDIVAISRQGIRLVQVKSNRYAPPIERERIATFETPAGVSKEIWIFRDYARGPIIRNL